MLAVIGLLVGGILGGQALVRGANVQKVLTDAKLYATAKEQFRQQYGQLPGDFKTATSVWGDDNAACADAGITNGTPGTCNGDGDGYIYYATAINQTSEQFQLWKQLKLAGYIGGDYTGLNGPDGANYDAVPGLNSPATSIKGATFWHYGYWGTVAADGTTFYAGNYTNAMTYGTRVAGGWPYAGAISPAEAKNIDTKGDDGLPGFGNIRTLVSSWLPQCTTTDSASTSTYRLDSSVTNACHLVFLKDFQIKNAI